MLTRRQAVMGVACLASAQFGFTACSGSDTEKDEETPDTRGWPSLIDTLPTQIREAIIQGRYNGDLTSAIESALATGSDFVIPPGIYPFAGGRLQCRTAGQRIVGTGGVLRRLAQRDGIGLLVSADRVTLYGMRLDGTAPGAPTHHNDMVKVTGSACLIDGLQVRGSWGSNLRLDGARGVRVLRPILTDAHQNNLIVCNAPSSDILIDSPVCQRTRSQNNIFVTASEGSSDNGEIISRVVIRNPLCTDAADTAIELGYHTQDCTVTGGRVANSYNQPLLQRDGLRNRWADIVVLNRRFVDQHPGYDGAAVIPQWEAASWNSETTFENIVVQGAVQRSAFYWGQSGIRRINCISQAYISGERPPAPGRRIGSGDLKAGDVSDIVVEGGRIDGFGIGDNWNFDAAPHVRRNCVTRNVTFSHCDRVLSCFGITPLESAFVDNRGTDKQPDNLLLVNAILIPTDKQPDIGLLYDGNSFASTTPGDPATSSLLTRNSRFVRVPARSGIIDALEPQPGYYRIEDQSTSLDFQIASQANGKMVLTADAGAINATIENDRLVLHQRRPSSRPIWVKVAGPGIIASSAR